MITEGDAPGLSDFTGTILDGRDLVATDALAGRRVAIISTGSLAVRLLPRVARVAASTRLFQRDPGWVLPAVPVITPVVRRIPPLATRLGRAHLRASVRDPELRRQLTPMSTARRHPRPRGSRDFYRLLQRHDVELITWPIARLTTDGIQTADGIVQLVDVIVLA